MNLINNHIVVDNFFSDPKKVVEYAKNCYYYENENFEYSIKELENLKIQNRDEDCPSGKWRGYRTKNLKLIDENFYKDFVSKIKKLLIKNHQIDFDIDSYFHFSTKNIAYDGNWWHIDKSCFAGVIYLTENPPSNSGTILKDNNFQDVIIENVFNRITIYDSLIVHRPQSCFGDNLDDSRLTLTFFINDIKIKSEYSTAW